MTAVLVVDDERSIRATFKAFLTGKGYQVETAENAEEALRKVEDGGFDIVVSDIILPRMNGVELLQGIHRSSPNTQVIMITGEPTVDSAAATVRAGAFDYLKKPITKEAIIRVVENAARIKELSDEKRRLEAENQEYQRNLERLVEERTRDLKESEDKYRTLVEKAQDGIYIVQDGRFVYVNTRFCEMFGVCREELEELTDISELAAEESKEAIRERVAGLKEGEEHSSSYEIVGRHSSGRKFFLETNVVEILYKGRPARQGILRDITERKLHEKQLQNVITNTSHLINTPLTVVYGYLDLVKLGLKEITPDMVELFHLKLSDIRELVVEGLKNNVEFMKKETSDGLTPIPDKKEDCGE